MQSVRLTKLVSGVKLFHISDEHLFRTFSVKSISTDTRSLINKDLFIALPGDRYDGHVFIPKAVECGAACVVFSMDKFDSIKPLFIKAPGTLFMGVEKTRSFFGKVARNYLRLFPVKKIVVTGSAGKTTTKGLIQSVLSQRYRVASSPQSFNNDIGVPKTIFQIDVETDILVQEFGTNHPGEIKGLSDIVKQDYALITNIGPAHIGFFGSEENIAKEKKCALEVLASDGIAFLNAEDKYYDFLRSDLKSQVKSFGLKKGDLHPDRIIHAGFNGAEIQLSGIIVRPHVMGDHGIINCTGAALVGMGFGLSLDEIKRGLEAYRDKSGRGTVHIQKGVTIIDESYNANPLSVSVLLRNVGNIPAKGKKILVLGDMLELGDKSEYYHRKVSEDIIKNGIGVVFTYGEMVRATGDALLNAGFDRVLHFTDIEELVNRIKNEGRGGDIILVKGSRGMKLERVVQGILG
jgi:UDP-N-acetylmuramoyl-tripeptide--D-alanyl-D-alanine ligase